ncbi:hypothetical protein NMG60_11001855, partial [Bertholletia excelsa]
HFSHQRNLNVCQVQPVQQFYCSGCQSICSDSMYASWECSFFLQEHCGNANRFFKHPFHPIHPLVLLPSPTYCGGSFLCNACGRDRTSFSYSCAVCEVDLLLGCAFLPPKVTHEAHLHDLLLSCSNSQKGASTYNCKFCSCLKCDFRVHNFCATNAVKPGLLPDDEYTNSVEAQAQQSATAAPPPTPPPPQSSSENEVVIELSAEEAVELIKLQLQIVQLAHLMALNNISS